MKQRLYQHIKTKAAIAFCLLWSPLLFSCSDKEPSASSQDSEGIVEIGATISGLTVSTSTRDGESDTDADADAPLVPDEKAESVYDLQFDDNSILFVSQMTEKANPFGSTDKIFSYQYFNNGEETSWYEPPQGYGGYNFTPAIGTTPLEWKDIRATGTYGNGYALYAMYYPVDNQIRYNVEEDQSSLDNLMKSDILGAYHSTNKLFTRITFRLFHLMVYLKVTVYVPIWDDASKTGYFSDAMIYSGLQDAFKDFVIDWSAIRSSDNEGPVATYTNSGTKANIQMYQHPVSDEEKDKVYKLKYKDYLPSTFPEQPITGDYDDVRILNFSVIIPPQMPSYSQSDFLKFIFSNPSSEQHTYYFNYSYYSGGTSSEIQMNQGYLQHFNLYLPRVGSQVILMNADVLNWNDYYTELHLSPDE